MKVNKTTLFRPNYKEIQLNPHCTNQPLAAFEGLNPSRNDNEPILKLRGTLWSLTAKPQLPIVYSLFNLEHGEQVVP